MAASASFMTHGPVRARVRSISDGRRLCSTSSRRSTAAVDPRDGRRGVLALDLGGTRCMAAVVDSTGTQGATLRMATPTAVDAEGLFQAVAELADRAMREGEASIDGFGVGCGGPMRGVLVSPLHIPAWRDFPLRSRLEERFGLPCVVDNDAKAMALGEWWRGAGRSARAMLGIVVSTGVRGGRALRSGSSRPRRWRRARSLGPGATRAGR